jgi:hypothetical protein
VKFLELLVIGDVRVLVFHVYITSLSGWSSRGYDP